MEVPESRRSTDGRSTTSGEKFEQRRVVVAVDATRELQLAALHYALKNFVRPGDNLYLLGILHQVLNPMGYKQKADSTLSNGTNEKKIQEEIFKKNAEFQKGITDPELQKLFDLKQVTPEVHIAPGPSRKVVTAKQAVELRATWVILDKNLRKDKAYLMEQLNCNIVLMKPKNGATSIKVKLPHADNETGNSAGQFQDELSIDMDPSAAPIPESCGLSDSSTSPELHYKTTTINNRLPTMTESTSSPPQLLDHREDELVVQPDEDLKSEMVLGEVKESSEGENGDPLREDDTPSLLSSTDMVVLAGSPPTEHVTYKVPGRPMSTGDLQSLVARPSTLFRPAPRSISGRAGHELMYILNPPKSPPGETPTPKSVRTLRTSLRDEDLTLQTLAMDNGPMGRLSKFGTENEGNRLMLDNSSNGRKKNPRSVAPLCSFCNHPGPVFGREAITFTYAELEEATNNFDPENYLAEGGYGFVYRGTLPGGQEIAVKQYKATSSQGDDEFYSEVEVLKHAQHRNLVILIGSCTEKQRRLLVYEFVCNKSLDVHLSAKNPNVLEWRARWKIAVGAARGLRYLHEECRVGCIVHRDMRPNNILLTHDFVPMVGDFGLARNQPSGDNPEETRVIGTLGYLAPEYAESGSITEKADVYSFGVVLLELITGRKAIDATRVRGETSLTEWAQRHTARAVLKELTVHILRVILKDVSYGARPLIQAGKSQEIVDPRLKTRYDFDQFDKMVDAAGRCISKDPSLRPKMSEVLRILEQDANSGSMSRGGSANDLSDISRNPPPQRALPSSKPIRRQGSLDSVHSKASDNSVTVQLSQREYSSSVPVTTPHTKISKEALPSKPKKLSYDQMLAKSSSGQLNPDGKSSLHSSPNSKSKPKLSYDQMVT